MMMLIIPSDAFITTFPYDCAGTLEAPGDDGRTLFLRYHGNTEQAGRWS
jgi:hypothetical protein